MPIKLVQWENDPDPIILGAQEIATWHGLRQTKLVHLNLENMVVDLLHHTLINWF